MPSRCNPEWNLLSGEILWTTAPRIEDYTHDERCDLNERIRSRIKRDERLKKKRANLTDEVYIYNDV